MSMRWPLCAVLALFASQAAHAVPDRIIFIRHGEKPDKGNQLNQQGCERAYLLPAFFAKEAPKAAAFYASRPDDNGGSVRPVETISPTAKAMGLPVLDAYTRVQYPDIVADVRKNYDGQTIVMSWEHAAIPGLAEAFGLKLTDEIKNWPDQVFDEAWVLDFTANKATPTLTIIPEAVLPGDNPQGGLDHWGDAPAAFDQSAVPSDIVDKCADDKAIDALASALAKPPLP